MQIVSITVGDSLHEMTKLVFWGKKLEKFKMLSAENFTPIAKRFKLIGNTTYKFCHVSIFSFFVSERLVLLMCDNRLLYT